MRSPKRRLRLLSSAKPRGENTHYLNPRMKSFPSTIHRAITKDVVTSPCGGVAQKTGGDDLAIDGDGIGAVVAVEDVNGGHGVGPHGSVTRSLPARSSPGYRDSNRGLRRSFPDCWAVDVSQLPPDENKAALLLVNFTKVPLPCRHRLQSPSHRICLLKSKGSSLNAL